MTNRFSTEVRGAFRRGDNEAVVRMSKAEIERARATGEPAGEVEALYSLARVAIRGGDLAEGERLARTALTVAARTGDRALQERPRHVLAAVARMSGDLERATVLYRANIALNEELGDAETVNSEIHNLAFCELGRGHLDEARALFATSRERVFLQGWDSFTPYVCVAGAALASAEGDHRRAALLAGVADAAFAALGQIPDPDDAADLAAVGTAAEKALGTEAYEAERARGRTLEPRAAFAPPGDAATVALDLRAGIIGLLSLRINEPDLPWPPFAEQADRFLSKLVGLAPQPKRPPIDR